MSKFHLEIVTPERKFFEGEVETVIITTPEGEVGVLNEHEQSVFAIAPGVVKILVDGKWKEAAVSTGFMEVTKDKTIALVDSIEWPEEIDINRAKAAKERAEERLTRSVALAEHIRSQASLARALARLKVTGQNFK